MQQSHALLAVSSCNTPQAYKPSMYLLSGMAADFGCQFCTNSNQI